MAYICITCNQTFKRASTLNVHRKTAKYCLELQKNKTPILNPLLSKFGLHKYELYIQQEYPKEDLVILVISKQIF